MTYLSLDQWMTSSAIMNAFEDIGKYSSLLYGIANVIGDEPQIGSVIGAGVVYLVCGVMSHSTREMVIRAARDSVTKRFDNLEEKLIPN